MERIWLAVLEWHFEHWRFFIVLLLGLWGLGVVGRSLGVIGETLTKLKRGGR